MERCTKNSAGFVLTEFNSLKWHKDENIFWFYTFLDCALAQDLVFWSSLNWADHLRPPPAEPGKKFRLLLLTAKGAMYALSMAAVVGWHGDTINVSLCFCFGSGGWASAESQKWLIQDQNTEAFPDFTEEQELDFSIRQTLWLCVLFLI